jgi:hypothetical protein
MSVPHEEGEKHQRGIALLGVLVLGLILSLVGVTLLNLAWQEAVSAQTGRKGAIAQLLAEAAGELVVGWFHRPRTSPPSVSALLAKRHQENEGRPSFFDQAGRSQFTGTPDHPDLWLDAANPADDLLLNDPTSGLFHSMRALGTIRQLKIYAPSKPGLLCTIDTIVETDGPEPLRQSVSEQFGTLDLPALRAAVQVGQGLGLPQPGRESFVGVHWGALIVGGALVLRHVEEFAVLSSSAPITGQGYGETTVREDRWITVWAGGPVKIAQPLSGQPAATALPSHVHAMQNPIPGVRFDRWSYDVLKRIAMRYGSYFGIDQAGLLYPNGAVGPGRGVSPDQVFRSKTEGNQLGLIFVDTLDQTAPRDDNLGTVKLNLGYFEGLAVVQGHVLLNASAAGSQVSVLSPPSGSASGAGPRVPVQLSGIHLNGVLYAAGNITVNGAAKIYGTVTAEGTITSTATGPSIEVWYNHDMGQGLFAGLPVVFHAPGTWIVRY